ncbi:MAG: (d)CMP kinase [Lachnospiraceae bacterium]|nr:(d)CMP kinase [Lachnospiraceae bacterium]
MSFKIAIDGPAGAGKSTIAKALAQKISFLYVDTGAMYRAMAYYILTHGIRAEDGAAVQSVCGKIDVSLGYDNGLQNVYVNGENVSGEIRREEVGNAASVVSTYPAVREALLTLQRGIAAKHDVIMDGRDIGTCILPDAQLKIYLTASAHTRALRRYKELEEKGEEADLDQIERDIEERDDRDMHRAIAPLRAAEDAVTVDSSDMTIEEVVNAIYHLYENRR